MTKKWYWGKFGNVHAEVFSSVATPTKKSHGSRYSYVTGPFKTKQAAVDNAQYMGNEYVHIKNPGVEWHLKERLKSLEIATKTGEPYHFGAANAHYKSALMARRLRMNPTKEWQLYDAFPTKELAEQYAKDYIKTGLGLARVSKIQGAGRLKYGLYVIEKSFKNPKRLTSKKARLILHHKKVKGFPLTEAQRGFFGARASGYPRTNPYEVYKVIEWPTKGHGFWVVSERKGKGYTPIKGPFKTQKEAVKHWYKLFSEQRRKHPEQFVAGLETLEKNPTVAVFGNPGRAPDSKVLSYHALELGYIHKKDGKAYKHEFEDVNTHVELLPDGSLRLFNPHVKLWDDLK